MTTDKKRVLILSDDAKQYYDELNLQIDGLEPLSKKILKIEVESWGDSITSPPLVLQTVNELIDIFNRLHNKDDDRSKQIRRHLQDVLLHYLHTMHIAVEKYNQSNSRKNTERLKKSIPLIKDAIGIFANKSDAEKMTALVEKIGQHINEDIVDDACSVWSQFAKNSDFEKIVQQILEKIESNRNIIDYDYHNMKIDEAVKDYKVWLEGKRKRRNILKIALSVASVGLAALIAKLASDNK